MTSDAKIGLLLGLVFIFVIAFVINGLPSLRPPMAGNAEVTAIAGEDFGAGIAGPAATVPNLNELLDPPRAVEPPKPAGREAPQPSGPLAAGSQASQPSTAGDEDTRFSAKLAEVLGQFMASANRGDTFSMDTPQPAPEQTAAGAHQPVASVPQPRVEAPSASRSTELLAKAADAVESAKPAPVAPAPAVIPGGKTYVVVAGDTLPAIAKRFYGLEEGNRVANVTRIYEANRTLLPSADEVKAGQTLVIPPPLPPLSKPTTTLTTAAKTTTAPARNPNKPADVLDPRRFEPRESMGKRAPAAVPPPAPGDRWYTVQDGDSLWKIASSQLGAGSRWDEIHKLNAESLTSQDALKVGMRLRLPAK